MELVITAMVVTLMMFIIGTGVDGDVDYVNACTTGNPFLGQLTWG